MMRHLTIQQTGSRAVGRDIIRFFQIRLSRLMVLVAIVAVLFSAWMFHRDNRSGEHAWTSNQINALRNPLAARRREGAENLHAVERDDLARTVAALAVALTDSDWQVRRATARSLAAVIRAAIGPPGAIPNGDLATDVDLAVKALIPACRDPRDEVRIEAQQALGSLFEKAGPSGSGGSVLFTKAAAVAALDGFSSEIEDASPLVRAQAVWSFARVGPIAGAAADAIKQIAENDPDRKVRIAAINALRVGWPDDRLLYPLLLRRLKVVSDLEEHANIAWTFGSLACPPYEVLPALLDALSPDDWILRRTIPQALGKLGAAARPALPALARVAEHELKDENDALTAIEAMAKIDPDSTEAQALVQPLAALFRDSPSAFARQQAMARLMQLGPSAGSAVPTLREALKNRDPDVRQRTCHIFVGIGGPARSALPDLTALARNDPSSSVRSGAQKAAATIDSLSSPVSMPAP